MLSQTAEYALRAVLYLADNVTEGPIPVERIAEATDLPRNYLSKTLHVLGREGILSSSRGPHGGFELAVAAGRLTLFEVVRPFEAAGERRSCLLGRTRCNDSNPCPAHHRWKEVADDVAAFFRETTVKQLLEDTAAGGDSSLAAATR